MIPLLPADQVEVTIVIDNTIDVLMGGGGMVRRLRRAENPFDGVQPVAQHGFSALLRVTRGGRTDAILFDTGVSAGGFLRNLDILEVDPRSCRAVVLSHGHADHALGLEGLFQRLGESRIPLLLHPDAALERRLVLPNGRISRLPAPALSDFRAEGIEVVEAQQPSLLLEGTVLISGEVSRTTGFETGFPGHEALREGEWSPDPVIADDQCAIVSVAGKGLVIVTGCGHAGIINIVRNAQRLTGEHRVHAIIGGFHLTGPQFEPRIPETIAALKDLEPRYLMPGHCTGWRATHAIAQQFPEAFISNSVGTTLRL